ncbi:MAG: hypothetical protein JWL88_331 [Parcubacteria group bacterium]|nr:hypothetical protein [Parcubacteria group bacterium]
MNVSQSALSLPIPIHVPLFASCMILGALAGYLLTVIVLRKSFVTLVNPGIFSLFSRSTSYGGEAQFMAALFLILISFVLFDTVGTNLLNIGSAVLGGAAAIIISVSTNKSVDNTSPKQRRYISDVLKEILELTFTCDSYLLSYANY